MVAPTVLPTLMARSGHRACLAALTSGGPGDEDAGGAPQNQVDAFRLKARDGSGLGEAWTENRAGIWCGCMPSPSMSFEIFLFLGS